MSLPRPGDMDDINLEHYHVGQTYVLPSRLASLLILSGCAELVDSHPARADAADFGRPLLPRKRK